MILVFIFLGILALVNIILFLSTLKFEIVRINIANKIVKEELKIKNEYILKISIILGKIPLIWITIDNKKMRKIKKKIKFKDWKIKQFKEKGLSLQEIHLLIKNIKIKFDKFNLRVKLGTEDAGLTAYLNAFISSVIGIILPHLITEKNIENCYYIISPIYHNKNEILVQFDGIFYIKIVHIIYGIFELIKNRRIDKNERTSNRRFNANSYGFN